MMVIGRGLVLGSMCSGSGKTVIASALIAALGRRGFRVRAFKCGPDYIDPMFHKDSLEASLASDEQRKSKKGSFCRSTEALETDPACFNLDLFLQGEDGVLRSLSGDSGVSELSDNFKRPNSMHNPQSLRSSHDLHSLHNFKNSKEMESGFTVIEGCMGFYDGISGTEKGSTYDIARLSGLPAVLIVRPKGASVSLAAAIKGMLDFRKDNHIEGLILSECSPSLYEFIKPILEKEADIKIFGYLPRMNEAVLDDRYLGLLMPDEVRDFKARIGRVADQMERTIDIDGLIGITKPGSDKLSYDKLTLFPDLLTSNEMPEILNRAEKKPLIAVAKAPAFCFYYDENLKMIRNSGAEISFFNPMEDKNLPDGTVGIYLGGGYPELYLEKLSGNVDIKNAIKNAAIMGIPIIAEGGGFIYLNDLFIDEKEREWKLCGILRGSVHKRERLIHFGYHYIIAENDSLLFRAGERIPVHEFHYCECSLPGNGLLHERPGNYRKSTGDLESGGSTGRNPNSLRGKLSWREGYVSDTLYAGFPQLHFGSNLNIAKRFVRACQAYQDKKV